MVAICFLTVLWKLTSDYVNAVKLSMAPAASRLAQLARRLGQAAVVGCLLATLVAVYLPFADRMLWRQLIFDTPNVGPLTLLETVIIIVFNGETPRHGETVIGKKIKLTSSFVIDQISCW